MLRKEATQGSFSAVSTGMVLGGQVTVRVREVIKKADIVFSLIAHPLADAWLKQLNPNVVNLQHLYSEGKHRLNTYEEMIALMMEAVDNGLSVCGAFYGHAGVFAWVPREMIKRVKSKGYFAYMEPGISAEACLYCDLEIDPGSVGIQSYEASQLLYYGHEPNIRSYLLLWQIALAGDLSVQTLKSNPAKVQLLVDYLINWYPENHKVIIYEAAVLPIEKVREEEVELKNLANQKLNLYTTLVIPPAKELKPNKDLLKKLKMKEEDLAINR